MKWRLVFGWVVASSCLLGCGGDDKSQQLGAGGAAQGGAAGGGAMGGAGGAGAGAGSGGSGGTGAAAGSAGSGAESGEGGTAGIEGCEGIEILTDGVLDLDLRAVYVQGTVTLNGQPGPTALSNRGEIVFRNAKTGDSVSVSLESSGVPTYSVVVPPGIYDVEFDGNSSLCDEPVPPEWPCNGGTLLQAITVETDGVLDLDVPAVAVQGNVTVNGGVMPDATSSRGSLELEHENGETVDTRSFDSFGPASYALKVFPGTYTVSWDGNSSLCDEPTPAPVPCNRGPVLTGVSLTQSGVLDVDVPAVPIQGTVTVNGAPMADTSDSRGRLEFSMADSGSVDTDSFGYSGPATYAITLLAGTYDVEWNGNSQLCKNSVPSAIPCNSGPIMTSIAVMQGGVLDVDVPAVSLQGTVTVNGAPMLDAQDTRGWLDFELDGGGTAETESFGYSGPASYAVTVLPGVYDVSWDANSQLCHGSGVSPVPCNGGPLMTSVMVAQSGVLDVDVPSVAVQGSVTVNGAPMLDAQDSRGALVFDMDEGSSVDTESFGYSGPASYSVTLLAGTYDVRFDGNSSLCDEAVPSPVPCNEGVLMSHISVAQPGVLDVDVPSVVVQGSVTLMGGGLPDSGDDRGDIDFVSLDGDSVTAASLGYSGPGTYTATLLPGRYVIEHDANSSACDGPLQPALPCVDQMVLGCANQ